MFGAGCPLSGSWVLGRDPVAFAVLRPGWLNAIVRSPLRKGPGVMASVSPDCRSLCAWLAAAGPIHRGLERILSDAALGAGRRLRADPSKLPCWLKLANLLFPKPAARRNPLNYPPVQNTPPPARRRIPGQTPVCRAKFGLALRGGPVVVLLQLRGDGRGSSQASQPDFRGFVIG